jgi:hypothetical protein
MKRVTVYNVARLNRDGCGRVFAAELRRVPQVQAVAAGPIQMWVSITDGQLQPGDDLRLTLEKL